MKTAQNQGPCQLVSGMCGSASFRPSGFFRIDCYTDFMLQLCCLEYFRLFVAAPPNSLTLLRQTQKRICAFSYIAALFVSQLFC